MTFIAGTLGQGGAERQLFYILKSLLECGGLPRVLSLSAGEFWEEPIAALGIPIACVGRNPSKVGRLSAIVSELFRHSADVVQSQHFYTNLYAVAAARILGVREIGAIRNTLAYELRSTGRFLGEASLRAPRLIAANSSSAVEEARDHGMAAKRLFYLPNVVDTHRFVPSFPFSGRPGVRLLAAGRLVPQKRFDRFLDALARVRKVSRLEVTGTIVGSGPLLGELEERARILGLSTHGVEFVGSLTDMRSAYSKADVFVLTSDHEGTPNVLMESMASGLPVIAMNVGGVAEHVRSGENGIAVEPGNDEALVSAILSLVGDSLLRERLGRIAREDIVRKASVAELPRYLSELYPLCLAEPAIGRIQAQARSRSLPTGRSEAFRARSITNVPEEPRHD